MPPRSYTEEQRQRVIELYLSPLTVRKAAEQAGVSYNAASSILRKAGVIRDLPLGWKLITEETVERAHEMVEDGLSVRETARQLDVHPAQLRSKLKVRGTKMRTQSESAAHRNRQLAHRQHAADAAAEEIIHIFKTEDVSMYEIADRFGTARKNVRRILTEAGIPQD